MALGLTLGCGDPPPPRVVLVTVPSLPSGAADAVLGPHAEAAVCFESFYAATPWVAPSVASILTGLHPWDHAVLRPGDGLRPAVRTVAEELAERGFVTAAVLEGPGAGGPELGPDLVQGFREVVRAQEGTDAALVLLDRLGEPAGELLWIHLSAANAVMLDRLLDRLDADAGRYETHVIIAAAHGRASRPRSAPVGGAEELTAPVHATLLLLSPRVAPVSRRDVAGSVDVARTLLSLGGVAYPPAPWSNGRDLSAWAPDPDRDPTGARAAALGLLGPPGRPTFYALDRAGRLYAGGGNGLIASPPDAQRWALEQATDLFRGLGTRLGRQPPGSPPTSRSVSPPPPSHPAPPPGPGAAPAPP